MFFSHTHTLSQSQLILTYDPWSFLTHVDSTVYQSHILCLAKMFILIVICEQKEVTVMMGWCEVNMSLSCSSAALTLTLKGEAFLDRLRFVDAQVLLWLLETENQVKRTETPWNEVWQTYWGPQEVWWTDMTPSPHISPQVTENCAPTAATRRSRWGAEQRWSGAGSPWLLSSHSPTTMMCARPEGSAAGCSVFSVSTRVYEGLCSVTAR